MQFIPWPKTPRWKQESFVITEKIDGTNAAIIVSDDGKEIGAQSRNKLITPEDDNYGFARWVHQHKEELLVLGPGHHFGEWWGLGIQRGYDMKEKVFSLFNTSRWQHNPLPECCRIVPVLFDGAVEQEKTNTPDIVGAINNAVEVLRVKGSVAAPGFMRPEGICVYLRRSGQVYKVPFDK